MAAKAFDDASEGLTFEKDIRPILRAHCYDCHGATDDIQGNLDLRQVRLMLKGGESGPAISPGAPDDSYLVMRVADGEMPPGDGHLPPHEIETLKQWIQQGAKTARPEPEQLAPGLGLTPEERSFWSFRPIVRAEPPTVTAAAAERVRNPIDAFLLAAMPEGLMFAAEADKPTLIRRLYFDLTGLPPAIDELTQWQNDTADDWYDRLIEELLASPHYGERWARHWLDVAGYADSDGATVADTERAWAWKYRDYVVRSFNNDKPFDQFIIEQLAGDELAGPLQGDLTAAQTELLTATGFLRMAADGTGSGANDPTGRNQVINDTLRIVSTSLLGLSMACAQCHDHRYDPIPQTDYFALRAVFAPALDAQQWKTPGERLVSLYTAADRQKAAEINAEADQVAAERATKQAAYMAQALEKELTKYEASLKDMLRTAYQTAADQRTPDQKALLDKYPSVNISPGVLYQYLPEAAEDLKKFDAKIAEIRGRKAPEEFISVLTEPPGHTPETHLFHRGDFQQPKQVIAPAALSVACDEDHFVQFPANDESLPTTGRRLAFARWITGTQNPLTARVLANRIWMHHFGRGIASTPADFGKLGTRPTHPELLSWLADEFRQRGFRLKDFHRLILKSSAWRQSTARTEAHDRLDPDNRFFSRRILMRLDAETLRDRMLAVSGKLDPALFGAPIPVKEDDTGQIIVEPVHTRRSLYIKVRRSQPVAMLQAFDAPVMETNCEIRPVSTVATQSLMLMNSETVLRHARDLAERARREPAELSEEQLAVMGPLPRVASAFWQFGYGQYGPAGQQIVAFTPLPHWNGSMWAGGPTLPDPALGYALLRAEGGHPDVAEHSVIRRWIAPADGMISISGSLKHNNPNGDGVQGRVIRQSASQGVSPAAVAGPENTAAPAAVQLLGEWTATNSTAQTPVSDIGIRAGDVIDFVTDCRTNITSDSFEWPVTITLRSSSDRSGEPSAGASETAAQSERIFSSVAGFHGPLADSRQLPGQMVRAWQLAYGRLPNDAEQKFACRFLTSQLDVISVGDRKLPDGSDAELEALSSLCQALLTSNEFLYID